MSKTFTNLATLPFSFSTILSQINFDAPYKFSGLTALSDDKAITFFTLLFNADEFTVIILQWVILPVSIIAIFFGTIRAVFEIDIKKLLAFSSLAQIGYITIGLSLGTASGIMASFIHIANHSMMKAALFMGIGAISIKFNQSIKTVSYTHLTLPTKRIV